MSITVKQITQLLSVTCWSFVNARDSQEIQEKIKVHGYDTAHMDSLIQLRSQMDLKYQEQQKIRAERDVALNIFSAQYSDECKQYQNLRLMVKKILLETEYEKYKRLLGIEEYQKRTFAGFIEQARKLYVACQNDTTLLNRLTEKFKKTAETFLERLTALDMLIDLHNKYVTARGLSQVATRDRDIQFRKFRNEWADFRDICKIAYEDEENPQYKELVGITTYSPGYQKPSSEDSEPPAPTPTPTPTPTPSPSLVATIPPVPPVAPVTSSSSESEPPAAAVTPQCTKIANKKLNARL